MNSMGTNGRRNNSGRGKVSEKSLGEVKKDLRVKRHGISVLVLVFVLLLCIWFCYNKFFLIKKCVLEYDGNLDYTEDEVLKGAGLDYGMKLYELDNDTIKENVLYNLPYIDSFKIKRIWPDKICFEIVPAVPSMYTVIGDNAFVLSQSLRVLSQTDDFDYIDSNKLINVKIQNITSCVAGEYLKTDSDSADTVKLIYSLLEENGILSNVDEIDANDRFDMSFGYKSRYLVKLGDKRNLDLKIRFMISIEEKLGVNSGGVIDVSDENVKEGIVKGFQ